MPNVPPAANQALPPKKPRTTPRPKMQMGRLLLVGAFPENVGHNPSTRAIHPDKPFISLPQLTGGAILPANSGPVVGHSRFCPFVITNLLHIISS